MTLDRQAILGADDLAIEPLDVPEWGGQVFLRTMTSRERDTFELAMGKMQKGESDVAFRASLAARCLCDESGERLFRDSDINALAGKNAKALDRVFDAAMKINKFSDNEIGELEKNLETCQSEDSASS